MEQVKSEEMLKFPARDKKVAETPVAPTTSEEQTGDVEMQKPQFQEFENPSKSAGGGKEKKLDMLMGISLPVSFELGRTNLEIRSILDLARGTIIEFDKMASEPVDILINGKKMAEGEVVVIDKHFAIRVTSLVDSADGIHGLGK
jgi:flagellar motor switch protein FliN/FliY